MSGDTPGRIRPVFRRREFWLVIFGSRNAFPTFDQIEDGLSRLDEDIKDALCSQAGRAGEGNQAMITTLITGKAAGADSCGEAWARRFRMPVLEMPARWDLHGRSAGMIRNRAMAERATHGLGFHRGNSRGTANMAMQMALLGKPCHMVAWEP